MNQLISWLKNGTYFILSEFLGQIIAAIILIAAFVAWVYFSTWYAAIPVVIVGIILWGVLSKLLTFGKNKFDSNNN